MRMECLEARPGEPGNIRPRRNKDDTQAESGTTQYQWRTVALPRRGTNAEKIGLKLKRAFGFLAALTGLALLFLTGPAVASAITITFDSGGFDPNPAACNYHGPYDYLEGGARIQGVWLQDYGLPTAENRCGHMHIGATTYPGATGDATRNHQWKDAVQLIRITLENNQPFSVLSIDTRVRARWLSETQPDFERPAWSWSADDVHMLVSNTFNPENSLNHSLAQIESYFTPYSIDDQSIYYNGAEPIPSRPARTSPFTTTQIQNATGTEFYFVSTGFAYFDNIVLVESPEPGTAVLLGLGLAFLGARQRRG